MIQFRKQEGTGFLSGSPESYVSTDGNWLITRWTEKESWEVYIKPKLMVSLAAVKHTLHECLEYIRQNHEEAIEKAIKKEKIIFDEDT